MDKEECSIETKRREIEETVLQILKSFDLETATELSVRAAAAERLGFSLENLTERKFVGQLVQSFLLSNVASIIGKTAVKNNNDNAENNEKLQREKQQQPSGVGVASEGKNDGKVVCELSDKRRVTVHNMHGATMVAIRDSYLKDGKLLPQRGTDSGLSLTGTQWSSFRNSFPSIEEAIVKLESQLRRKNAFHPSDKLNSRFEAIDKQSEADMTNSMVGPAVDKSLTEAGISNLTPIVHPPIKRKQIESEADASNPIADFAAEKNQTQAGNSNSMSIFHSPRSVTVPISQEHILVERKQEAAGTSASVATPSTPEHIRADINQTEAGISIMGPPPSYPTQGRLRDTLDAFSPDRLIPDERKQSEAYVSTSVPTFPSRGQSHGTVNANHPGRLIPIQPARLDGRNYHSWRRQMEFFMKQLNIAYVLTEPCPSTPNPEACFEEQVKAKITLRRWIDNDFVCRHNIMNSLCDDLFKLYSQKSYSARELWEELKLLYEDFGTKRSQINKYIHFEMVEGVSILEQVQELHDIAHSIMASGTSIDENFHASVIVSKLPPSWKELRASLMHEEVLPLSKLMHCLQVEEESRNCYKKETTYKHSHRIGPKPDNKLGMRKMENKGGCYNCGKEGHIRKNCPDKRTEQ